MQEKEQLGFRDTPQDWARLWKVELDAACKRLEKWWEQGQKIDDRFRDERDMRCKGDTRMNLFSSDVETKEAMIYGQIPKVSVSRRFADAQDDIARVAGEALERMLNSDIERDDDTYAEALTYAFQDRLLPGLSQARVRYVAQFQTVEVEAQVDAATGAVLAEGYSEESKVYEDVETNYVHWRDFLWSPARIWPEVRWVAFRAEMSRPELINMFGEEIGRALPLNAGRAKNQKYEDRKDEPWHRAEVWEIWSKEHRRVFHFVDGWATILFPVDNPEGEDPLGLTGFFPCPRPIMANVTTSKLVPRPDFVLAQDQYDEIDLISTRITLLQRAIAVKGLYDRSAGASVGRLINEANRNELLPVENWALFAEKGGIKGQIDWLPLEQITNALTVLRDYRTELIDQQRQITGMSDIMRGQAATAGTSATEQAIKAKFGSVRMQRLQDEFARFATDLQKLKAEIIAKHFDTQTILQRCNCQFTADAEIAPQAVEFLKSDMAQYRIEVKAESVSLQDFAALKQERTEVVGAVAQYLTSASTVAQSMPGSTPYLLEILQSLVAGLRGSADIEGILDRAIQAAQQQAQQAQGQPPPPDPKIVAAQIKQQGDMAKEQQKLQSDLTRIQAEVQADTVREQTQAEWNTREAANKAMLQHALKQREKESGLQSPQNFRGF